jgi:class 3 adenylate cyclase
MDTEWLLQRLGNEFRVVFPEMTTHQEEDLSHRTRVAIRKWQSLGQARAESKLITILFSDIRGFTSIAENYPAMRVVDMLNRYLSRMCEIIIQHGGTIDKFMGDSIMVLFGAPVGKEDDVERAIACAGVVARVFAASLGSEREPGDPSTRTGHASMLRADPALQERQRGLSRQRGIFEYR